MPPLETHQTNDSGLLDGFDEIDQQLLSRVHRSVEQRVASDSSGSPRFAVIAGIAAVLLMGMLFGASLWVLVAIAAGLLVAANYFLAKTWATATVATRSGADDEVKIGSHIQVQLNFHNRSRIPVLWLLAEDLLPRWTTQSAHPTLAVEGERIAVMMLWPNENRTMEYQIHCHRRGYFQVGPTVLETGDMMGLYRRYRVGTDPQYVTVLPEVVPLTTYEIGSRRPIGEIRMRESVMDDPTRLRGIRQWQIGDPMRSVHWAATARTGVLHSKIYEPSSIIGATLVLDLHETTTPTKHEPFRSDLAVTAAASIAAALHEAGEPFALATNGRDASDRIRQEGWDGDHRVRGAAAAAAAMKEKNDRLRPVIIPTGRGPVQFQEIHRTLARLERTGGLTLAELLIECESQIAADTTLLVIVQIATPETIAALVSLARRGRAVAVIINTHDINDYSASAGPLIASRIPTFHLADQESVANICRQTLAR
ncbi:hypothetical protein K227x_45580 [Rubripirellula lacrimiformis]|uniref:DUF58 domain-containing protein n=1 Tax=Rubripirellula lacrimiformis TaxID=1930273 RepID=A0A517NGA1_9BACT|nr:DUF58 domain-containing protein [Rubripirellula lacrimiformis]QDT06150.1 hypothetical protein K227x_45580 [Rubripirellula lacrimiformis]